MRPFWNSPLEETCEELYTLEGGIDAQHLKQLWLLVSPQYRLLQVLGGSVSGFYRWP